MAVIPFPQKSARTSPQRDPSPVAVNAKPCGRDLFVEARIRVLSRVITAASLADDMRTARKAQAELGRLALRTGFLRASKAPSEDSAA